MARHHRSLAFVITFTTATWLIGTIGCQASLAQAGGAPVPALISDAPVDSGDRTPSGATSGRVVAAPSRITDFAPAERSVTVDAGATPYKRTGLLIVRSVGEAVSIVPAIDPDRQNGERVG